MVSRTKFQLDDETVKKLFAKAGIDGVTAVAPLGAGEFNAVFEVTADKPYVLKIAPKEDVEVLTYEHNMMQSEVYWYSVIREQTGIRVPDVLFSDYSHEVIPADWFIMEKMEGEQRDKFVMTDEEKSQVTAKTAKMMAQIHKVHNEKFGYIQNGLYDNWYLTLTAMIENLLADGERAGKHSKRGKKFLDYVKANAPVFEQAECCMVNYDLWDQNVMCTRKDGKIEYAWIDPERSFWGDRIFDFICLDMMKNLEDKEEALRAYNEAAEYPVTAGREERIRYAAAQAMMGLIMETEKYYRYTPHHFGWWRNVAASAFLFKQAFATFEKDTERAPAQAAE